MESVNTKIKFTYKDYKSLPEIIYAPFDVHLGENVVQPDILFVSKKRSYVITEEEIKGAPDLVIEILSPATAERDRTYKKVLYARYGVSEYWIVDPGKKTIEVLTLKKEGYKTFRLYKKTDTLTSPLLLGLNIKLTEVF